MHIKPDISLAKFLSIWKHYNEDVYIITLNDNVAWIQLFSVYCMKSKYWLQMYEKIVDSPSILISFNNARNTHLPARQKINVEMFKKLPVIAGWWDVPLMVEDLVEVIFIINLHDSLLVSNTNFMTARESQLVFFGELNTDLQIDSL